MEIRQQIPHHEGSQTSAGANIANWTYTCLNTQFFFYEHSHPDWTVTWCINQNILIDFRPYRLFFQDCDWPTWLPGVMVVSPPAGLECSWQLLTVCWRAQWAGQCWFDWQLAGSFHQYCNSPHVPAHLPQRSVLCLLLASCKQQHKHLLATSWNVTLS